MRLVDDFLLVTQNSSVAYNFDLLMSQGIKEYNCYINNSKTLRNYYITDDGHLELIQDSKIYYKYNSTMCFINSGVVFMVWSIVQYKEPSNTN